MLGQQGLVCEDRSSVAFVVSLCMYMRYILTLPMSFHSLHVSDHFCILYLLPLCQETVETAEIQKIAATKVFVPGTL